MVPNTRLYDAAIAFVSGVYFLWSASMVSRMMASSWLLGVLGAIVIVYGAVLLSSYSAQLGTTGGPLMMAYSVVMLLNQGLLSMGIMAGDSGMGMGRNGMATIMEWDLGKVAFASLMLISGFIMTRGETATTDSGTM